MIELSHPYTDLTGGEWLRGNLHTHSKQSDGAAAPQDVIDDYARRGYGFLMLSDHDVYTSEEAYRQWESRGMILIPGNELAGGPHLLHVDADRKVDSRPSRQEMINEINAAPRGFAIVNHPNWEGKFDHATIGQMREWTGYLGLEIYNGIITVLDGSPYATNKWDILLSEGRRLWGFANDDSHRPQLVELGWNTAYVKERTVAGVVEALRNGRFYPSTGVTITKIAVEGTTIRLETENAHRIVALRDVGKRFAVADDKVIEVEAPAGAKYVRFECWGAGERFAWTQPFFVEETVEPGEHATDFIMEWQVSRLLEHGTLEAASPEEAANLPLTPMRAHPAGHAAAGFIDVREKTGGGAGMVYLRAEVKSNRDARGLLKLGYDGPVRAWVNGREIFAGPGTNPAVPDKAVVYANFKQGTNTILVAFDTNNGKAWGIYARVEV
jgi:hypothetical protein